MYITSPVCIDANGLRHRMNTEKGERPSTPEVRRCFEGVDMGI